MATRTKPTEGTSFTIVTKREVATIAAGMGDLPAALAAAVEIMADYRRNQEGQGMHPQGYEFTIPPEMDDGAGRDLDRPITYMVTIDSRLP